MNAIDVVKKGLAAAEAGQSSQFADTMADDMLFVGPVPQPLGKREFVSMQASLVAAMPDWKYNASNFVQNGDQVTASINITGTQTGELNLSLPGIPKIPATGKHVSLPDQPTTFTVKDGKVTRIEAVSSPDTGIPGILAQLGISLPRMG